MTQEINYTLYRYDLEQPPTNWETTFKNFEYNTEEYGHKNKANLFFFTDSIHIANDLGKIAAKKYAKSQYYLTSVQTETLKLIDFSDKHNIYQMLCLLQDLNIDVLTKDFRTYESFNDFSHLKSYFETASNESDSLKRLNIVRKLKAHSNSDFTDISLFGQRLTDFDNGIKFKEIVKEKYSDIDGYMWQEFKDNRGLTHCLFDSEKLITKRTEIVDIQNASS